MSVPRPCLGTVATVIAIAALPAAFNAQPASAPETAPTDAARDGDPVDLATGLYVRRAIDILLSDRRRSSSPESIETGTAARGHSGSARIIPTAVFWLAMPQSATST
jgi:hypothetical protein